jgi:hypothetical protein
MYSLTIDTDPALSPAGEIMPQMREVQAAYDRGMEGKYREIS